MKTSSIEFDQFRDHLDQALAEAEQGEVILTRGGKPWIVMRPASDERKVEVSDEGDSPGISVGDTEGRHEGMVSLVGKTVAWARAHFEGAYRTTLGGLAFVDGEQVPEDHVLEEGHVLEFAEEPEDEEWAAELYRSPEFWEMIRRRRGEDSIPWEEAKRRLGVD